MPIRCHHQHSSHTHTHTHFYAWNMVVGAICKININSVERKDIYIYFYNAYNNMWHPTKTVCLLHHVHHTTAHSYCHGTDVGSPKNRQTQYSEQLLCIKLKKKYIKHVCAFGFYLHTVAKFLIMHHAILCIRKCWNGLSRSVYN